MPRWLPESFYSTKLEMTPLGTKKKMTVLFAVGLSMAVAAFGALVWWFATQSMVTETVVLAKVPFFYDGKEECKSAKGKCDRMLEKDGTIPPNPDKEDWNCTMLSLPASRPITYDCMSTEAEFERLNDPGVKEKAETCEQSGESGNGLFAPDLYDTVKATEQLESNTFEPSAILSGYAKKATGLKLTHRYQLYEKHEECEKSFKCMAPPNKDILVHSDTETNKVKGCLITGLGPTVTSMDRSVYLDLTNKSLTIDPVTKAFGGRRRRNDNCPCAAGNFCNMDGGPSQGMCESCANHGAVCGCSNDGLPMLGVVDCEQQCFPNEDSSMCVQSDNPTEQPDDRGDDIAGAINECLQLFCEGELATCKGDQTPTGCNEELENALGGTEPGADNALFNNLFACYDANCQFLTNYADDADDDDDDDDWSSYDDDYGVGGSSATPKPIIRADTGTEEAAQEACRDEWNALYCGSSAKAQHAEVGDATSYDPRWDDDTGRERTAYLKTQFCMPFMYQKDKDTGSMTHRGNPPYACTRQQPRQILEAISLSFSFAEFFYMIVLFGMCRLLWQTYLGTDAGKRAQAESDALEKRLAREAKARAAGEAAPEEDVITLTRKEYDMFLKLSSKMKPARTAAEASQAYITVGDDHGAEDAHADFGAAGANLA